MGNVCGGMISIRWAERVIVFWEDIIEKCIFCKTEDNWIELVTNNCIKFKKVREELIDKLNKLEC